MGKKKRINNLKSTCCKGKVVIRDNHYVCLLCGKTCNVYVNQRKTWKINPATKIKKDERKKFREKLTKKEIEEIRKNEDF